MERLIFAGKQLDNTSLLISHQIEEGTTVHLILRLQGGGPPTKEMLAAFAKQKADEAAVKAAEVAEMTFAAGGTINQVIFKDKIAAKDWDKESTVTFNLQVLNATKFESLLGIPAPSTPVTKETYAAAGHPFFKLYEENSGIKGDFGDVKSVGQLRKAAGHNPDEDFYYGFLIVTLNPPQDLMKKTWLMLGELEALLIKMKSEVGLIDEKQDVPSNKRKLETET